MECFLSNFTQITQSKMTKTIFYLNLKHVPKYGSAKFQPNQSFSSQQMATESAAEEKQKNKKQNKKTKLANP